MNGTPASKDEFNDFPHHQTLTDTFSGPGVFTVKGVTANGSYGAFSAAHDCVVICTVFSREEESAAVEVEDAKVPALVPAGPSSLPTASQPRARKNVKKNQAGPATPGSAKRGMVGRGRSPEISLED